MNCEFGIVNARRWRTTILNPHFTILNLPFPISWRLVLTRSLIAILIAAALAAMAPMAMGAVMAHEDREEGGYKLVVGFMDEPAYEGERNAVSLRVTKESEDEEEESSSTAGMSMGGHHDPAAVAVEGLQDTVQVEVTHVPSNISKVMNLRTVFNDPGHYAADLIPTSPGHYRFRFFGTIEGEAIDAAFDSRAGGGDFDDVQVATAIHFPDAVASARELESAVRGLQAASEETHDEDDARDSVAATMAIAGIVLGAVGIAFGGVSLALYVRSRNS